MKINIRNNRARLSIGSESGSVAPVSDEDFETDGPSYYESEESSEEEDEDDYGNATARITRTSSKQSKLPYSPRKTRAQKVFVVSDSDEASNRPLRRSGRAVKVPLREAHAETEGETSDAYSELDISRKRKGAPFKGKKPLPQNYLHPAYGLIRPSNDLAFDDDDFMRKHRLLCEKCHRRPSHSLLAEEKKRTKGRRKKKGSDDDLEESGDEMDRLISLGGWVKWYGNCSLLH
jgi:chromodomain-helicase-DNA-binding protein 4